MKTLEPLKESYLKLNKKTTNSVMTNWQSDCNFISFEITFLKKLLESYPFKVSIPNLFEDLQLFREELNVVKDDCDKINEQIKNLQNQKEPLQIKKAVTLKQSNSTNQNIEIKIVALHQKYQKLKIAIYEYMLGLINA